MAKPIRDDDDFPERPSAKTPVIREPRYAPLAHMMRGDIVEGVHYGSVVVLAADGSVEFQSGDIEAAFYPRSALKPLQTVAMLRVGLSLEDELLALATASHSGEERHLAGVRRILATAGLTEDDLGNTPDQPYDHAVRQEWVRRGRGPSRLAQKCSGKHAAMLMTARARGWPLEDYLDPGHRLQRSIARTVEELTGESIARVSVDGCGAPLFSTSLRALTRAVASINSAAPGTEESRVAYAIREYPEMASGSWRDVARLMRAVPGLLAKDGFEGVQVAALPDGRAIGVKIADGADRARMPVTAAALALCGVDPALLAEFASTSVLSGTTTVSSLSAVGGTGPRLPRGTAGSWAMKEGLAGTAPDAQTGRPAPMTLGLGCPYAARVRVLLNHRNADLLRRGLAGYRQLVDSHARLDEQSARYEVCGRRGRDGCDPAHAPHPGPPSPAPIRRAARTLLLCWRMRRALPAHLRSPFGTVPTHDQGSCPF